MGHGSDGIGRLEVFVRREWGAVCNNDTLINFNSSMQSTGRFESL